MTAPARPFVLLLVLLLGATAAQAAGPKSPAAAPVKPPATSGEAGEHMIPVFFAPSPNAAPPVRKPLPPPQPHTSPAKDVAFFVLVIVAVFLVAWGAVQAGRALWRRRSRRCPSCGKAMRVQEGSEAFAHLDLAERTEQFVGDVQYVVWACAGCGHVEKISRVRAYTGSTTTLAPVGSATYLRQQHRDGLSIWPTDAPAAEPPSEPSETGR